MSARTLLLFEQHPPVLPEQPIEEPTLSRDQEPQGNRRAQDSGQPHGPQLRTGRCRAIAGQEPGGGEPHGLVAVAAEPSQHEPDSGDLSECRSSAWARTRAT